MGALSIGVLGGTFDPIHIGHLVLAQEAFWQLGLERVLLVPAGQPWRKEDRVVSEFAERAEMTRIAAEDRDYLEVSLLEGERPGPSYIVDTLAQLAEVYDGAELLLLLGQDALADLRNWKDPQGIKKLARLAVASRAGSADPGAPDARLEIDMPRIDVSSTLIRERVGRGQPWELFVTAGVADYIKQRGLYLS